MILYEIVKTIHISAVSLSVLGFITRVIMTFRHVSGQHRFWFKTLPHIVDSMLLASALYMVYLLQVNPLTTLWIAEKLISLVLYILLGMLALHWGKSTQVRISAAIAALLVFTYIVYVAHYKDPFVVFSDG